MKKILFLSLSLVALLTSCTSRMTDFTVISTKNFPIGHDGIQVEKSNMPDLKEAIDDAIQSYPGCVGLADGVVKRNFWWAFFYGQNKYIVEGTPKKQR